MMNEKAIIGCILGTAVGDALGLPYEGMSPTRAHKLLGPPVRYRFVFGRGMISDDTEHTCMVLQSLIESGDNTVPVAIHCWLSFPNDFRKAVTVAIECGGDADTTAAIVGGIVGASVGKEGIPAELIGGIREWPRSIQWMESLGVELSKAWPNSPASRAPIANPLAVILRNLVFLVIVLCHGFRRLGPPY